MKLYQKLSLRLALQNREDLLCDIHEVREVSSQQHQMRLQLLSSAFGALIHLYLCIKRFFDGVHIMMISENMQARFMARLAELDMSVELFRVVENHERQLTEANERLLQFHQRGACYVLEHRAEYCYLLEEILQESKKEHHRLVGMALEEEAKGAFARAAKYKDMVYECNRVVEQLEDRLASSLVVLGLAIQV